MHQYVKMIVNLETIVMLEFFILAKGTIILE
jgi:hypothetical protein